MGDGPEPRRLERLWQFDVDRLFPCLSRRHPLLPQKPPRGAALAAVSIVIAPRLLVQTPWEGFSKPREGKSKPAEGKSKKKEAKSKFSASENLGVSKA
jgi:hypothetical protein